MGTIVVGIDGSEGSRRALQWAATEAALRGAALEAVYVYEHTPSWQLYGYGAGPLGGMGEAPLPPAVEEVDEEERATELVESLVSEVRVPGVEVRPVTVRDRRPAKTLVERSKDAELLVVGSRGRGGFAGLLIGSVSQQCIQYASCPVVVITAGA